MCSFVQSCQVSFCTVVLICHRQSLFPNRFCSPALYIFINLIAEKQDTICEIYYSILSYISFLMRVWTVFNMFKGTCFVNCLFISFAYFSIKFLVLCPSMSKRFFKNIRTTNSFSLTYVTNSACWIFCLQAYNTSKFLKNTGTCFVATEKKKLWQAGGWEWFYLSWSLWFQLGFLLGSLQ